LVQCPDVELAGLYRDVNFFGDGQSGPQFNGITAADIDDDVLEQCARSPTSTINPTLNAIREALGGGSFATISPVLRDWRESKDQRATVALKMPGEARSALERAGVDLSILPCWFKTSAFRPKGAPATSEAKLLSWARIREGMQTPS
jgi:hypothetical protein